MKFGAINMISLLWLIPIIIVFGMWADGVRKKTIEKFAEEKLSGELLKTVNISRKKLKNLMITMALVFILIALLKPQWGFSWQEVKRQGLDILIALDTSNSMLAEDVKPNRLRRSKLAIRDLVRKLVGDRVGLVAFSGRAFLQCPLTVDYNGFLLSLEDISANTIPVGGTSIASAIYTAIESYEGGKKQSKVLIIITDGEDLEGEVNNALRIAKEKGITIYCVGIGTEEGELIPIRDDNGRMSFLKDSEGNVVKTRLDEATLEHIALDTGGMYVRSSGAEFGLDLLYDKRLSKLEKEDFKSRMEKKYKERFQFPLVLVFLLLLIEPVVSERRKGL
jgi:Ca-activated chloride channel homolog